MIKKLNLWILGIICLCVPLMGAFLNYLLHIQLFEPLSRSTGGLLHPTLIVNLFNLTFFGFLIFYAGRLDFESVFLNRIKILQAIVLVVLSWLFVQLISIGLTYSTIGTLNWIELNSEATGRFLGQLFGNAAFEELIFRALLLVQLFILLKRKLSYRSAVVLATIASQLFFALIHIPNRLIVQEVEYLAAELFKLFCIGVLLAWVFIRTENLPLLIGLHALINLPMNVVLPVFPTEVLMLGATLLVGVGATIFGPDNSRGLKQLRVVLPYNLSRQFPYARKELYDS